jgi:hypothetical protein
MRSLQHIILDFENTNKNQLSEYWATTFLQNQQNHILKNVNIHKKFLHSSKSMNDFTQSNQILTRINSEYINSSTLLLNITTLKNHTYSTPSWYNLININFLRKERLYTKLKYSRSPAYDTVSGGAAAILAGFLGFLVSEKFGMELVDSGDFYFLIMYIVFISFSVRPLLTILNPQTPLYEIFTLKANFFFYSNIFTLFFKKFL